MSDSAFNEPLYRTVHTYGRPHMYIHVCAWRSTYCLPLITFSMSKYLDRLLYTRITPTHVHLFMFMWALASPNIPTSYFREYTGEVINTYLIKVSTRKKYVRLVQIRQTVWNTSENAIYKTESTSAGQISAIVFPVKNNLNCLRYQFTCLKVKINLTVFEKFLNVKIVYKYDLRLFGWNLR